jgi:hypothetical protein
MNLHFITSISRDYWYDVAQYCVSTWDLPGKITIYIDQKEGEVDWFDDVPHTKRLLYVPNLEVASGIDKNKTMKFWGKSCAQIDAVLRREDNERIIWLDADVEQTSPVTESLFDFSFENPLAIMKSNNEQDCWETGLVIFNQEYEKLNVIMNRYKEVWNDENILNNLWKPYDAQVLGYVALNNKRTYYNLCDNVCNNADALAHSRYGEFFKHWINKTNKKILSEKHNEISSLS